MGKVILFYKYVSIPNPHQLAQWQREICTQLGLKGRIILGHEGINGCLGGTIEAVTSYQEHMNAHPLFDHIDFKESEGGAECFPRLRISVKKEIVHLGIDPAQLSAQQAGTPLDPAQVHELLTNKPDNLVIIDCRNEVESAVGAFEGAIKPNTQYFREFPQYVDNNLELFKDKEVLMYCTGGIRCERGSAYVKSKNVARNVYHIKGGIHRYVEQFPDGFFRGKNYVFDGRIAVKVTDDVLSNCLLCSTPCDQYTNCINALCNKHFICCTSCLDQYKGACGLECQQKVANGSSQARPPLYPSCRIDKG
jgi:predicted sulfurtransferase